MNEAEKLRKAIEKARSTGMSISGILAIIEKVYGGQVQHFVWRTSG